MSQYLTRNRTILAKVETTAGVDASPTVGSNAVRLENVTWPNGLQSIQTNEFTDGLDAAPDIPGGGQQRVTATGIVKGSGVAGTAPELDPIFQACSLSPATIAVAVTGTAQSGGDNTIRLASGASSTDGFYVGAVVNITSGTGSGQSAVIIDYEGSTREATVDQDWDTNPDNTSVYSVPIGVTYKPVSSGIKTVTIYDYRHRNDGGNSRLKKVLGAAGSFTFTGENGQPVRINADLLGSLQDDTDVSHPGAATFDEVVPSPLLNAYVRLGGVRARLAGFEINSGGETTSAPDITEPYGFGLASITRRVMGGSIRLPDELQSVRNYLQNFKDGIETSLVIRWGPTSNATGRRCMITIPRVQYGPPEDADTNGMMFKQVPFRALGSNSGFYLTFY